MSSALLVKEYAAAADVMRSPVMHTRVATFSVCVAAAIAGCLVTVAAQAKPDTVAARLQVLEDRDAIRALLVSYASTLDNRDFAGFEQLWAQDAEFVGGGSNSAKGPAAIRDLLQRLLTQNGSPTPGRDFHLVMNQTVDVNGDSATGFSRGTWVSTNAEKRLQVSIIANYYDQFVREGGRWKFKRHQIGGTPPAPNAHDKHK
jgi:ketosteroid isomerase-like protein